MEVATSGKTTSRGRRYRASFVTRTLAKLADESDSKGSYVVGILLFNEKLEPDVLRTDVLKKLLLIPRFRSKYVSKHFSGYFEEIPEENIDVEYHMQVAFDNQKPSQTEVLAHVSDKMCREVILDKDKPLWQFTIVPELDDGRGCLITNISHVIGDGMSQIEILYRLIDPQSLADDIPNKTDSGNDDPTFTNAEDSIRPKDKRPRQRVPKIRAARIFLQGVLGGMFAVLGRPDPQTSLKLKTVTSVSVEKRQALTDKILLDKLKDVKNKIEDATVNDILVVLLTRCLRKYFEEHDGKKLKNLSASFPISMRKKGESSFDKYGSPHNKFAYGMIPLHLKYKNTLDLIWKVKRTVDEAKLSPNGIVQQQLGKMIQPFVTKKVINGIALNVGNKSTVQLSNVAGPQKSVSISGFTLDEMAFQLFSPLGLYVGIISYNGQVSCSFNADSSLGKPEEIAKHWKPEFDELYDEIMSYKGILKRPSRSFFRSF
mmetsp:Transcript_16053/g.18162  ORF Transcript_16053/g.18162 Transcript_16053/m.18162 type:complete len:486 (-) Transcript_16053:71-1528(-)